MEQLEKLRFLNSKQATQIAKNFGTPVYVYSQKLLVEQAKRALLFPAPYGLTIRYAMKANSNRAILETFNQQGLHIDASSAFEVERALLAGFNPEKIMLTTQQSPTNLKQLVDKGIIFNAGSLRQLEEYGKLFPNTSISIRVNTGLGEGMNNRLKTGGPSASFGIWHEHIVAAKKLANKYSLRIIRVHNHVGTGGDPRLWKQVAIVGLKPISQLPDVEAFNMGGGFSVAYRDDDIGADMQQIGKAVSKEISQFAKDTGRKLKLEIEPGRYLVAAAGTLLSRIHDITSTGEVGYEFIKLDTGMTEIIRPAMYGSYHPIVVVGSRTKSRSKYVVVGHCCETSDTLTTAYRDPEAIQPRLLQTAKIGDLVAIEMTGAYCSTMSALNYHSFPQSPEVMLMTNGKIILTRRRQTLQEILMLENVS